MQLDKNDNNLTLGFLIAQRIAGSSCYQISFSDYMDLVLYHPQHGYYATTSSPIGATGDFITSPHVNADFGELLAQQFVEMWQLMHQPTPFTLVEMGAGQGLLAFNILTYLQQHHPDLASCLNYCIVERATAMIQAQQRQLQPLLQAGIAIQWCELDNIAPASVTGCFFSNELVDALPVHQVTVQSGELKEIYVSLSSSSRAIAQEILGDQVGENNRMPQFIEVIGELSTLRLVDYFNLVGVDLRSPSYPDCYRSEVNLAALDWIDTVAQRLHQGYVLTIDYGYASDRYYNPVRREGTLQCYYRHRHHSDPYIHLGMQDITAHVDFTALQKQGEKSGLHTVGLTKQSLFLMALGLGDRLATLSQSPVTQPEQIQQILIQRDALHSLINPLGLGGFGVLIQSKNVDSHQPLTGLMGEKI